MKKLLFGAIASLVLVCSFSASAAHAAGVMVSSDLTLGSQGMDVTTLQNYLVANGYLTLPAGTSMGYFGTVTQKAVMKYQMAMGLSATGYVGAMTRADLSGTSGSTTTGTMGTMMPSTSTKAADLRVAMNNLLTEHVSSSISVLKDIQDGNTKALQGALWEQDQNAVDFAAAVGSVYGTAAQTAFLQMFRDHITASNAYTQGIKDGNMPNQTAALAALDAQLVKISSFLSGANPNIDNATLLAALRQHENLVNESSQAYGQGNYQQAAMYERQALTQIEGGADYLSAAIVKQYPDKFAN